MIWTERSCILMSSRASISMSVAGPRAPPTGRFEVHGMKCLISVLNIKADGIYHCVSASYCIIEPEDHLY
jgi:hypothetical protein